MLGRKKEKVSRRSQDEYVMVDDDSNTQNKFKNVFGSMEYDLLCK